jgi:hypothetical protein
MAPAGNLAERLHAVKAGVSARCAGECALVRACCYYRGGLPRGSGGASGTA